MSCSHTEEQLLMLALLNSRFTMPSLSLKHCTCLAWDPVSLWWQAEDTNVSIFISKFPSICSGKHLISTQCLLFAGLAQQKKSTSKTPNYLFSHCMKIMVLNIFLCQRVKLFLLTLVIILTYTQSFLQTSQFYLYMLDEAMNRALHLFLNSKT